MSCSTRTARIFNFSEGREPNARHVSAELDDLGPVRHLQLCASGETVLDVTYPAPIIDPPINDVVSPGETEEDFDYTLFLHHVLNDPARMAVCIEAWA